MQNKSKALANICFSCTPKSTRVLVTYILSWSHGEWKGRGGHLYQSVCAIAMQCCGWVTLWRRGLFALVEMIQSPRTASGNGLCLCDGKVPMVANSVTWQEAETVHVSVQSLIKSLRVKHAGSTTLTFSNWIKFFFKDRVSLHSWGGGDREAN